MESARELGSLALSLCQEETGIMILPPWTLHSIGPPASEHGGENHSMAWDLIREALGLRWVNPDFENRMIRINLLSYPLGDTGSSCARRRF